MGSVKGKYIKDENGTIFSPIVSTDTAFDANGVSVTDNIGDIGSVLDSLNGTSVTDELQSNKAVTISENGTTTITPDSGYDGMSRVMVTVDAAGEMQAKSQTITTNTTTIIKPDSGYDGLSQVSITTKIAGGTLSVPAITNTNSDKLSKSLTLNANKTGVLVFHYVTALHWYYKISVAGTKIVERRGNQDVGTINTVASGWTSRYLHKGTGDGSSSEHTEILLIPASSKTRTIAIEASSAYGGRFSWYTLIQ